MLAMEGWVEVSGPPHAEDSTIVPTEHKSVQTEQQEPICQTSSCGLLEDDSKEVVATGSELPTEDRSVEECLIIYKSQVKIWVISGQTLLSEALFRVDKLGRLR
jgi:hypothetical protein